MRPISLAGLVSLLLLLALMFPAISGEAKKSDPPPAPPANPPQLLFMNVHGEMDKAYTDELEQAGIAWCKASLYDKLPADFFSKFTTIVIEGFPGAIEEYNVFGQKTLNWWDNIKAINECLEKGAGVLVYTDLADCGGDRCGGWNREMKRWNIQTRQACIRDQSLGFAEWTAFGKCFHAWTTNLNAKHPVTQGLGRVYYVSANLRWDDCYTAPPLECGPEWTPIVSAMPGALIGTELNCEWYYEPAPKTTPVLAAVRNVGKGRMAVVSINSTYLHRAGYRKFEKNWWGEMCYGPVDGIILKKGDGTIPSDTGKLVMNLYSWLGEKAKDGNLGGYQAGTPVPVILPEPTEEEKAFKPVLDFDNLQMPASWKHRPTALKFGDKTYFTEFSDPLIKGELRYFKALVGAHTALSDGKGSVAEFAQAARKAGYDMIIFAENFAELSPDDFNRLLSDCRDNTTDDFICMPGFDIQDPYNNHLLIVNPPSYPPALWLSKDGKRLVRTQMINLCWYQHHVIAHRVGTSPLTPERIKHYQGMSIYTYRDGKLDDDSFQHYEWNVQSGSNPHPWAVHEVYSPAEAEAAAKVGFQQVMPADTIQNAASYIRTGAGLYFNAPARYMISEGPIVTGFVANPKDIGPKEENRDRFRVDVAVKSDEPLAWVALYDGFEIVRKWLPQGKEFSEHAVFPHDRQYGIYVVAQDTKGRRTITNSIRTVTNRYHYRCSDRQNWLGHVAGLYTGIDHPSPFNFSLPVDNTTEARTFFTTVRGTTMAGKLNFPFTTPNTVLTEETMDEVFVTALRADVGCDATAAQVCRTSSVCSYRMRNFCFFTAQPKQPTPAVQDLTVSLKRAVLPDAGTSIFPVVARFFGDDYAYHKDGKLMQGKLNKGEIIDLPVGGTVGGVMVLSPGMRAKQGGMLGLAAQAESFELIPAETQYKSRILFLSDGKGAKACTMADMLPAFGIGTETPYKLEFTRGKMQANTYPLKVESANCGVAGKIAKTAELTFGISLEVTGMRRHWPCGVWQEGGEISTGASFEGSAYPSLNVAKAGEFYAGHILMANNVQLMLSLIKWNADAVRIEVHNPTGKPIEATVFTPAEIKGYKRLETKVSVPAGSTVRVDG